MPGVSTPLKSPPKNKIVAAKDIGEAVHNLLKNGWTRLECESLARTFDPVIATFIDVTKDADRKRFVVDARRELDADNEPDLGLFLREKGHPKLKPRQDEIAEGRLTYDDTKFVYHHRPRVLGYYSRIPGLIERHVEFFAHISRMHGESQLLIHEIAEELDRQFPGFGLYERSLEGEWKTVTRLLRYLCDGPSPKMANRHRDQDFITIQQRSDRLGLWLADNNNVIQPSAEETRTDSVLIFFGRKAWAMTKGRLKGIVHGVTDTMFHDEVRKPRHTAVSFGHAILRPDEEAWGAENANQLRLPKHVDEYGLD